MNSGTYVDEAERVILSLKKQNKGKITTSKIRNLLSMTADIYNTVMGGNSKGDELPAETEARVDYLRIRFVYESGRDTDVGNFVKEAKIIDKLKGVGKSRKNFIAFSRYMEALVAFHRYYGGRDI